MNFKYIVDLARTRMEEIVDHFLPGGKRQGREYIVCNPRRNDNRPGSFSINLDTSQWADFATGDRGGDAISLLAFLDTSNQLEAAKRLAAFLGVDTTTAVPQNKPAKEKWTVIIPVPDNAPPPPAAHSKFGRPAGQWIYHDEAGRVACHVYRFDLVDGGKEFRPLTYCDNGKRQEWRWQGLPDPRPLYNLHLLTAHPAATVIVCEGERSADAAARLFLLPDYVTTTALNGAKSPGKTDWTPLAARAVWLWPDADEAGRGFADEVSRLIGGTAKRLNLNRFLRLPDGAERAALPATWDAADAVAEGFTAEHIAAFPDGCTEEPLPLDVDEISTLKKDDSPYQLIERKKGYRDGIYYLGLDKMGEPLPPEWICSPLRITALTRNSHGGNWGRLLEWADPDDQPHVWAMAAELTSGSGEEYRKALLDGGLEIAPSLRARNHLTTYIVTFETKARACCTDRTGWHDGAFVLPHRTIGQSGERVLFQSATGATNLFRERGALADWQGSVGTLCRGNSRLLFACSVGLASVLLELTGDESGGFHFVGSSSSGKTTALHVARSLFGGPDYLQRWRATDNGLEGVAAASNNVLLILDELAQVDPRRAGEIAYMLANGSGKNRANRTGGVRAAATWRLLFLSSGEIGLADHMSEAGKRTRSGQEIRLLDLPADAGAGQGIFENLHGYADGATFAKALMQATSEQYGTPVIAFLEAIIGNRNELPDVIKPLRQDFLAEHLPNDASGQAHRAAGRFALCAVAGELATKFGITGWLPGEAERAAARCFKDWLERRGGAGDQERAAILSQVKAFFELHGESRFVRGPDDMRAIVNRAGEVKYDAEQQPIFYVLPEVFRQDVCRGFEPKEVANLLLREGWLIPDTKGKPQARAYLLGMGKQVRCYMFGAKMWD